MRSTLVRGCLIIIGAALAFSAVTAYSQMATVYRYTGDGASAYFSNSSECTSTQVFVQFGESTAGSPPQPVEQPTLLYMYVTQYDACNGVYSNAQTNPPAVLPPGAAQVSNTLRSASLNATVELTDDSGTSVPVDVSIIWTAADIPLTRTIDHAHYLSPFGFNNANTRSMSRDAAAAGTVFVGGVNVIPSAGDGWIQKELRGAITIFKK